MQQSGGLRSDSLPIPRHHQGALTTSSGEYYSEPVPQATDANPAVQHSASWPIPRPRLAACDSSSGEYSVEPVPEGSEAPPMRRREGKIDGMDYYGW